MFTLWSSDVLIPSSVVTLVDILQKIRGEVAERHDYIGNWLYCLRHKDKSAEPNLPAVAIRVDEGEKVPAKQPRRSSSPKRPRTTVGSKSRTTSRGKKGATDTGDFQQTFDQFRINSWVTEVQALSKQPTVFETSSKPLNLQIPS